MTDFVCWQRLAGNNRSPAMMLRTVLVIFLSLMLTACLGMPDGVKPVSGFDVQRYQGKWYEIARLDHSFERGLEQVTAEYSLRDDGGLRVINRGFDAGDNEWREAEGRAYFVEQPDRGYLKVSFFGPFYASYVVFELDRTDYQYAFVAGNNTSYLWLMARTPTVSQELIDRFIAASSARGFATNELIFVTHQ